MRENCDFCDSKFLIKLSTIKHVNFIHLGYMQCSECDGVMPWELKRGKQPLVGSSRGGKNKSSEILTTN